MRNRELELARALHASVHLSDICDVPAIARHVGVPEAEIFGALARGELRGRRVGSHGWRVTRRAVLDWLEGLQSTKARDANR